MANDMAAPARGGKIDEVWVKLEGVLAEAIDPPSNWAVGSLLEHAAEVMALATAIGPVTVYGSACESLKGQRSVQRWMARQGFDAWVTYEQTPPPGVEVIDRWPMNS